MSTKAKNPMKKKNAWLIPVSIAAAAALIALIALLGGAERRAVILGTLESFYTALYMDGDFDAASSCIAPGERADFASVMTMSGANSAFFRSYAQDAAAEIGEGFTVSVRMTELAEYGAEEVAALRQTFPGTDKAALAGYEIVFTSAEGAESVYTNELILVQEGGRWYMTTHLTLPIGANMSLE